MRPHEPAQQVPQATADFEPTSDPGFVEFCAQASESAMALGRFARIMDRALELRCVAG
jgi:hypothetical protein